MRCTAVIFAALLFWFSATARAAEIELHTGETTSGTIAGLIALHGRLAPPENGFSYLIVEGTRIESIGAGGFRFSPHADLVILTVEGQDLGSDLDRVGVAYHLCAQLASLGSEVRARIGAAAGPCVVSSATGVAPAGTTWSLLGEVRLQGATVELIPELTVDSDGAKATVPVAAVAAAYGAELKLPERSLDAPLAAQIQVEAAPSRAEARSAVSESAAGGNAASAGGDAWQSSWGLLLDDLQQWMSTGAAASEFEGRVLGENVTWEGRFIELGSEPDRRGGFEAKVDFGARKVRLRDGREAMVHPPSIHVRPEERERWQKLRPGTPIRVRMTLAAHGFMGVLFLVETRPGHEPGVFFVGQEGELVAP